jgi:hypothetical protein
VVFCSSPNVGIGPGCTTSPGDPSRRLGCIGYGTVSAAAVRFRRSERVKLNTEKWEKLIRAAGIKLE